MLKPPLQICSSEFMTRPIIGDLVMVRLLTPLLRAHTMILRISVRIRRILQFATVLVRSCDSADGYVAVFEFRFFACREFKYQLSKKCFFVFFSTKYTFRIRVSGLRCCAGD